VVAKYAEVQTGTGLLAGKMSVMFSLLKRLLMLN
jgi:hypothetical protein